MKIDTKIVLKNVNDQYFSPCLDVGIVISEFLLKAECPAPEDKKTQWELARAVCRGQIIDIDDDAYAFIKKMADQLATELYGSFWEAFSKAIIKE